MGLWCIGRYFSFFFSNPSSIFKRVNLIFDMCIMFGKALWLRA
jgi:hypothetical protein